MTELQMLAIAYVFFIALIAVEIAVSLVRKDGVYRLGEMIVNVGHGVIYQAFDHLTSALFALPWLLLSGLVTWSVLPVDAWWSWIIGLLLFDFANYWLHRHHHEVHFLWAVHGVHHAAEDFNLAAALRQAVFQKALGWLWRLPLALVMPARMFIGLVVFDFLYQFLQHTRYVPSLGPIGWVFNTPSHHRVHHGTNEKYLDRNYGGILIIWDRLFGTFQVEEEEPTYGVTRPLGSLNAVWGNLAFFSELVKASRTVTGWPRLKLWLTGPARFTELAPQHPWHPEPIHHDADVPLRVRGYVIVSALSIPPLLSWMLLTGSTWPWLAQAGVVVLIIASVAIVGALLEQRSWAAPAEAARLLLATVAGCAALSAVWPVVIGALLVVGLVWSQSAQAGARMETATE